MWSRAWDAGREVQVFDLDFADRAKPKVSDDGKYGDPILKMARYQHCSLRFDNVLRVTYGQQTYSTHEGGTFLSVLAGSEDNSLRKSYLSPIRTGIITFKVIVIRHMPKIQSHCRQRDPIRNETFRRRRAERHMSHIRETLDEPVMLSKVVPCLVRDSQG